MPELLILFCVGVLLFLFLLTFSFFLLALVRDSMVVEVPFVPTRTELLPKIIDALELHEDSVLYDLGSGDARVLIQAAKQVPAITCVGIERGVVPFLKAWVHTIGLPIEIRRQDIFKAKIESASHIYCYLSDSTNKKLSRKILSECGAGVKIVSCDFEIPNLSLESTVYLDKPSSKFGRVLYIYNVSGPV